MSENIDANPSEMITTPKQTEEHAQALPRELWNRVLSALKPVMDLELFDLWLNPVTPTSYKDRVLSLEVPSKVFADWIRQNTQESIENALKQMIGEETKIAIVVSENPEHFFNAQPKGEPPVQKIKGNPLLFFGADEFIPRYTFDTFVEGQSNRFAKAAAEGVAKEPGRRFNPLFLYGGVGLGKTHLMHAIGHSIRKENGSARLLYVTSEKFINEFIDSLKNQRPADFRNKYRNLDCLMVDDIQFLMDKESSEQEFFHTFNILFDSKKQIVICSDRPPKELGSMNDRLKSRFEWGVVADIQPPDLETRIAILRKKADLDNISVPEDVMLFVASRVKSNIRELEGALTRIVAYSTLTGTPLTIDIARATLKDISGLEDSEKPITIETIQEVISRHFNIELRELKSKRRTDAIAWPRQIAMYLARTLTELSTTEIGEFFGGKDHTTVLHACEKVKMKLSESPFVSELVNKITMDVRCGREGKAQ